MRDALTRLVDGRPFGLTRIIVGAAALLRAGVAWDILGRFGPADVIRIPIVSALPDPASGAARLIVAGWAVAALAFTIGWRVRLSGTVLALTIAGYGLLDSQTYSNHLYLMLLLVILLTVGGSEAGLAVGRPSSTIPQWPVLLVKSQVTIVYAFAALTKLNGDFLSGTVLAGVLRNGVIPYPEAWRTQAVLSVVAAAAVFTELFLAAFLWSRRWRGAAFVLGLGLHLSITLLIAPTLELIVFSLLMLGTYPLFLDREHLVVVWDDDCGSCRAWIGRFMRFDLLGLLRPVGASDPSHGIDPALVRHSMHSVVLPADPTTHPDTLGADPRRGFGAVTDVLERTVPSLWIAPLLRLPLVRSAGERWYRRQADRRRCEVAA